MHEIQGHRTEVGQLGTIVWSNTTPGVSYQVSEGACTCKGYQYRGRCKHLAIAQAAEAVFDAQFRPEEGESCRRCGAPARWLSTRTRECALCVQRPLAVAR